MRDLSLDNTLVGAAVTFAMHLVWAPVMLFFGALFDFGLGEEVIVPLMLAPLVFIGVAQLLYVGPAFWWARRRGSSRLARGLVIGAGVTLLLNAGAWGLFGFSA